MTSPENGAAVANGGENGESHSRLDPVPLKHDFTATAAGDTIAAIAQGQSTISAGELLRLVFPGHLLRACVLSQMDLARVIRAQSDIVYRAMTL